MTPVPVILIVKVAVVVVVALVVFVQVVVIVVLVVVLGLLLAVVVLYHDDMNILSVIQMNDSEEISIINKISFVLHIVAVL